MRYLAAAAILLGLSAPAFAQSPSIRAMVTASAIAHGVPPALAHRVVQRESRYRCHAHNRSGASGIMQVMPRTARGVGVHGNLHDCAVGLEAGMRYLRLAITARGVAGASRAYATGF